MGLRIRDRVVRGEIDNRIPGIARGDTRPDPAGCSLTFVNLDLLDAFRGRTSH